MHCLTTRRDSTKLATTSYIFAHPRATTAYSIAACFLTVYQFRAQKTSIIHLPLAALQLQHTSSRELPGEGGSQAIASQPCSAPQLPAHMTMPSVCWIRSQIRSNIVNSTSSQGDGRESDLRGLGRHPRSLRQGQRRQQRPQGSCSEHDQTLGA